LAAVNLEHFRQKVREYRLLVNRNQSDLAAYLNLDYNELSNRLNAHKNTRLTHENIRAIVRALAEWGAITTRSQAEELLDLMLCPHFDPVDLQARPLSKLKYPSFLPATSNSNPALSTLATPSSATSIEPQPNNSQPPPTSLFIHNLPQQLSSFIGRNREVTELKKLLAQDKLGLVTLVGAGGSGKTRLALKVAMELGEDFSEGVRLVELASLNNPALILQTIALTLKVAEKSGRSVLENLVQYFSRHHVLLVLDNCEHLIEECSLVVHQLLQYSTRLQILATSRERLGINGGRSYMVPPLSLPLAGENITIEKVKDYEALQLFVERATNTSPNFELVPGNVSALVLICQRLDGIPLALELAAARTKMLTLEQVQFRLDDRFHLLTGGSRDMLPRHQTLRAMVDWSYYLLSEREKQLLAQVSVFAGSWEIVAGETICVNSNNNSQSEMQSNEVLDGLTNLANKSLLEVMSSKGEEVRYRLQETIKQYALEKLRESGVESTVREHHLNYFAQLAEDLGFKAMHHDQAAALKRLDQEHDNIRAGLDFGLKVNQADKVLQLVSGLFIYWEMRGYYSEGRHYLEEAVALSGGKAINRGLTLGWAGYMASQQGDLDKARIYFEEALVISKKHADKKLQWHVLNDHGSLEFKQGNYAKARPFFEETLPLAEELPLGYKPVSRFNLGALLVQQGEYTEANRLLKEGLPIARELGNAWMIVNGLNELGGLALLMNDFQAAHCYLEEVLTTCQEFGYPKGKYLALVYLSMVFSQESKLAEACRCLEESLALDIEGAQRVEFLTFLVSATVVLSKAGLERNQTDFLKVTAQVCGVISASRDAREHQIGQPFRNYYEQVLEVVHSRLDKSAFETAFTSGLAMSVEKATYYIQQILGQI
jgi:predicted ATPase